MAASPEFYKPAAAPAYAPGHHHLLLLAADPAADDDDYFHRCRTPTGAGISYLGEPATCPPAPRKPRPPPSSAARKRLFAPADVVTLRFDDLEAIFRAAPTPAPRCDAKGKDRRPRRRGRQAQDEISSRTGAAVLS